MRLVLGAFLLASAVLVLGNAAGAGSQDQSYDPRPVFAETDTNEDGALDLEEFHVRIVEVFYNADTNKDGYLSVDEYGQLPFSGQTFTAADVDGDRRISLHEFVRIRYRQFLQADTNHDGELSLEEVVAAYEERTPQ